MRKKATKTKPIEPSKRAERFFRKRLDDFISALQNKLIEKLRQARLIDDLNSDYVIALTEYIAEMNQLSIEESAVRLATEFVRKAAVQNNNAFKEEALKIFGIDLTNQLTPDSVQIFMNQAIKTNVDLISSIKTDFISDIGAHVFDAFKNGLRPANLESLIRGRGDVSKSRAKLIARDQCAKLNADFTQIRRENLGLDIYKWAGSNDRRERHSHRVLNNKLCKYSDPTVYSDDNGETWKKRSEIGGYVGNVGTDYQCRCVGLVTRITLKKDREEWHGNLRRRAS